MRVVLDHITKRFADVTAVSEFSATLEDGELVSLLGPSGCGKSTLLNMLSGILPVSGGKIYFDDQDVTSMPPEKRGIGLVFQNYALYPHMTVMGNICFPLETQRVPKAERIERANEIAKLVHVDMLMNRKPSELSGGQQQRVGIARALAASPEILLMDEPFGAVDEITRASLQQEIARIHCETGITVLFVTHDIGEALRLGTRVLVMANGEIQQYATPEEILRAPATDFVRQLVAGERHACHLPDDRLADCPYSGAAFTGKEDHT